MMNHKIKDVIALIVAVLGISCSAPLAVYADESPGLSIALWRNSIASIICLIILLLKREHVFLFSWSNSRYAVLAGIFLGLHFALWIPSLSMTDVGTSTALVCTAPIWSCFLNIVQKKKITKSMWCGVCLSLIGIVLLTGLQADVNTRSYIGDCMAITGGLFMAIYLQFTATARKTLSSPQYATICYASASLLLAFLCILFHTRIYGWSLHTWLGIFAITIAGQFCGHFLISQALRNLPSVIVSTATVLEIPGAAILALIFFDQKLSPNSWYGILCMILGLTLVIRGSPKSQTS